MENFYSIDLNSNQFIENDLSHCKYNTGHCTSTMYGLAIWSVTDTKMCLKLEERVIVLYNGPAEKYTYEYHKSNISIFTINSKDRTFALEVLSEVKLCYRNLYTTKHEDILVFVKREGIAEFASTLPVSYSDIDTNAYLLSKLLYLERGMTMYINRIAANFRHHLCETKSAVLRNAISIARIAPETLALALFSKPGLISYVAVEIAYIFECQKVPVERRQIVGNLSWE